MKISGFSFGRNTSKLYYPIKESILSILPICDEFIFVLGKGDEDDNTLEILKSINSPKLKIIHSEWDTDAFPNGMENAHQTDLAISHCTGDWLFYVQADEVVHEKYLPHIKSRCEELLNNQEVEGLLFKYRHFFGDYKHYINHHGWYQNEIRIVKNKPEIHSFESAQSFRRIPNFDGKSYRKQEGTYLLRVAPLEAYIYHYGWVRPPIYMQSKKKALDSIHKGDKKAEDLYKDREAEFDYGPLKNMLQFKETHPAVMADKMKDFTWASSLNYTSNKKPDRPLFKHEKLKYRVVSWAERNLNRGKHFFPFKNWELLNK
ncbi:MAG: glycosyltransferase family 2 protein [Flavobacteriales bacterium]|nr:glycosyltransferase family 2 protein [Flavobacteriales bacterium]